MTQSIACPVLDCAWTYDAPDPEPQGASLADVFGPGVFAAAAATQRAYATEKALTEHFHGHSTADYVRTLAHQRAELGRLTESLVSSANAALELRSALAEIGDAMGVAPPVPQPNDDLTAWIRSARREAVRLRNGRSAASGGGWAQ